MLHKFEVQELHSVPFNIGSVWFKAPNQIPENFTFSVLPSKPVISGKNVNHHFYFLEIFFGSTFAIYIRNRNVSWHAIFSPLISFIQQKFLTVQEVSSKPATQWFSLTCMLQHFPSNERCVLLSWCVNICVQNAGRKSTFGKIKTFHLKV